MGELTLWSYFADAGLVVKSVLLVLSLASVVSWTIIVQREFFLKKLRRHVMRFEDQFWSGVNLSKLYAEMDETDSSGGLGGIFYAGFREFIRLNKQSGLKAHEVVEASQRAMRLAQLRDVQQIERHLPLLASIGSVGPYVGLFGTVCGMMVALHALGQVEQASISMVAPGISEALIATAMGLFAAIPAVLAYNRYTTEATLISNQYDRFREEFISILQHQVRK